MGANWSLIAATLERESKTQTIRLEPLINMDAFDTDVSGPRLADSVIEAYLKLAPTFINKIEEGFARSEWLVVHRQAHSLKSSSANVGAQPLADLCKALELMSLEQVDDSVRSAMKTLTQDIAREGKAVFEALTLIAKLRSPDGDLTMP